MSSFVNWSLMGFVLPSVSCFQLELIRDAAVMRPSQALTVLHKCFLVPPTLAKDRAETMRANDGTLKAIILNQAITYATLVKIKSGSCSVSVPPSSSASPEQTRGFSSRCWMPAWNDHQLSHVSDFTAGHGVLQASLANSTCGCLDRPGFAFWPVWNSPESGDL